jgi:hypothetical protein
MVRRCALKALLNVVGLGGVFAATKRTESSIHIRGEIRCWRGEMSGGELVWTTRLEVNIRKPCTDQIKITWTRCTALLE